MSETVRMSIPGRTCRWCGAIIGESIICPGCKWADPPTVKPSNDLDVEERLRLADEEHMTNEDPDPDVIHNAMQDALVLIQSWREEIKRLEERYSVMEEALEASAAHDRIKRTEAEAHCDSLLNGMREIEHKRVILRLGNKNEVGIRACLQVCVDIATHHLKGIGSSS